MFKEAQLRYLHRNISFCNVSVTGGKILARFGDVLFNYVLLKPTFKSSIRMAKSQRSLVARLRAGILPLAPDVGRFKHFQEDNKLCELYELMESHFPLYWSYHDDETSFQHPEMSWDEDDNRIREWLFDVISNATNCSLHVVALVSSLFFSLIAVSCNRWTPGFDFIPC